MEVLLAMERTFPELPGVWLAKRGAPTPIIYSVQTLFHRRNIFTHERGKHVPKV